MFELSQLECFITVADELNFSRAATRLHMTQPPLSRQIRLLEHQLGVALFVRTTRSVKLTPAGRSFLGKARQLLVLAEDAGTTARRIAAGEFGHLTFSFISCAIYQFLPSVISQMQEAFPHVAIHLREMATSEQFSALRLKQVDVGIVRAAPLPEGITGRRLLKEPFVLAIPADNPLAHAQSLSLESVHQQPFISYESTSWRPFSDMISQALAQQGIQPHHTHSIGSTVAILSLVNGGMGMALVPASSADIRFENVVFRSIPPVDGLYSEILQVWDAENDNPVLPALTQTLWQAMQAVISRQAQ